jgi:hypothetical protein
MVLNILQLDFSSAFLHIPLAKSLRKWLAFNFENVFQFTTIPFGIYKGF